MFAFRRAVLSAPVRRAPRHAFSVAALPRLYSTEAASASAATPPSPTSTSGSSSDSASDSASVSTSESAPDAEPAADSTLAKPAVKFAPPKRASSKPAPKPAPKSASPKPAPPPKQASVEGVEGYTKYEPKTINYGPHQPTSNPSLKNIDIDWERSFHGIATLPAAEPQFKSLMRPLADSDIEVKPDGVIYLPEIKYRRRLNEAFGPMGWGMIPKGEPVVGETIVTREYALIVGGRYVFHPLHRSLFPE
jgi:hypothetical protein